MPTSNDTVVVSTKYGVVAMRVSTMKASALVPLEITHYDDSIITPTMLMISPIFVMDSEALTFLSTSVRGILCSSGKWEYWCD